MTYTIQCYHSSSVQITKRKRHMSKVGLVVPRGCRNKEAASQTSSMVKQCGGIVDVIDGAIYTLSSCLLQSLLCVTAIESNAPNTFIHCRSSSTLSAPRKNPCNQDPNHLFEGNETGRVSGTNTRPSVLDGLARGLLVLCSSDDIQSGLRTMRWRILRGSGQPSRA